MQILSHMGPVSRRFHYIKLYECSRLSLTVISIFTQFRQGYIVTKAIESSRSAWPARSTALASAWTTRSRFAFFVQFLSLFGVPGGNPL